MHTDGNLIISVDRRCALADGNAFHTDDLIKIILHEGGTLAPSSLFFDQEVLDATGHRLFRRFFVYHPNSGVAKSLIARDSFRRNEEVDAVFVGIVNGELIYSIRQLNKGSHPATTMTPPNHSK